MAGVQTVLADVRGKERPRDLLRRFAAFFSLHTGQFTTVVKTTVAAWSDDNAPRLAASLAYYTALSIAPLTVVILAIAGLAFGHAAAAGQFEWQVRQITGGAGARALQALVDGARKPATSITATVLGILTLCFGATTAVVELTSALNTIWHAPPDPKLKGLQNLTSFVKQRFFSLLLVGGVGLLLLASLFVNAWLAAVGKFFANKLPTPELLLEIANFIASFLVITFLFAVIYRVLPNVRLRWSDVAIGAAVTSVLFTVGKLLIALYLGKTAVGSAYGAAGSFVVLLVWIYYSSLVFFMGAEFTKVYTHMYGSRSPFERHGDTARPQEASSTREPEMRYM